jgi:hypothetical protein
MKKPGDTQFRIYPPVSVKDRAAYKFYKANKDIAKKNKVTTFEEWLRIINACYKQIEENVTAKKGGVMIKGLGYFAIWMSPLKMKRKTFNRGKYVDIYNDHTDHHIYHPSLFTNLESGSALKHFTMDREFHQKITRTIAKELRKGVRYVLRYTALKKIYVNEKEI